MFNFPPPSLTSGSNAIYCMYIIIHADQSLEDTSVTHSTLTFPVLWNRTLGEAPGLQISTSSNFFLPDRVLEWTMKIYTVCSLHVFRALPILLLFLPLPPIIILFIFLCNQGNDFVVVENYVQNCWALWNSCSQHMLCF